MNGIVEDLYTNWPGYREDKEELESFSRCLGIKSCWYKWEHCKYYSFCWDIQSALLLRTPNQIFVLVTVIFRFRRNEISWNFFSAFLYMFLLMTEFTLALLLFRGLEDLGGEKYK